MTGFLPEVAASQFLDRIPVGSHVLVALSGGGDSVGLLVALRNAITAGGYDISLSAVTVDHQLRAEAAAEADAMAGFCLSLGIAHRTMRWEGEKPSTGLSEAARSARYRLLCAAADAFDADMIVTGHTLDDQLETVQMRQSRTAGEGRGLAGMADATLFCGRYWVARPFLDAWRRDIREYLIAQKIDWFEDPSNESLAYERVRTRRAGKFAVTQEAIRAHGRRRTALAEAAAKFVEAHCAMPLPLLFRLDCADGLMDEAFRLAAANLIACAGGRSFLAPQESLERLWNALKGKEPFRLSIARTVVERRGDHLYICRDLRDLPEIDTARPGQAAIWDNRFRIEIPRARCPEAMADAAGNVPCGVPPRVFARALKSLPPVSVEDSTLSIARQIYLAPFGEVLPCFDLTLARAIMGLVGQEPLPLLPLARSAGLQQG